MALTIIVILSIALAILTVGIADYLETQLQKKKASCPPENPNCYNKKAVGQSNV